MPGAPAPADLRAIFGREPEEAIAYLRRKGYAITWNWHDVQAAAHARSFTVAKMTKARKSECDMAPLTRPWAVPAGAAPAA